MRLILSLKSNVCLSPCKAYIHVLRVPARAIDPLKRILRKRGNQHRFFHFRPGCTPWQIDYSSRQEYTSYNEIDVYIEIATLANEMFNF